MATLTAAARAAIPSDEFAVPEKRAYPIHDIDHARNALARVSEYGNQELKKRVRAAVLRKYPHLMFDDLKA